MKDNTGHRTMAIGVAISGTVSSNEATLLARAKEVALEVEAALRNAEKSGG